MKQLAIALAAVAAGLAALAFAYFLKIDSCLDAGGRWNHATRTCEH